MPIDPQVILPVNSASNKEAACAAKGCSSGRTTAEALNHDCFCTTLNRAQLDTILKADDLAVDVLHNQPQFFSNTAVYISQIQFDQMAHAIEAIERTVHVSEFQQRVLAEADEAALFDAKNSGVFMGYDFHLSDTGPKLIEINTNAGGALLNSALIRAQAECCHEAELLKPQLTLSNDEIIAMFLTEWRYSNTDLPLKRIAIVDENPQQQFLYPEFCMAKRLFERHGIEAIIVDPQQCVFEGNSLQVDGAKIDLVYNRLTDFALTDKNSSALREAYLKGSVVVTPNPHHHALYANKRNLTLLSDTDILKELGICTADIATLIHAIPPTRLVTNQNSEQLWADRKHLFFKPNAGFGGRAAYRGDKLTKRVWAEILNGNYVAQQVVVPSERGVLVDGQKTELKTDIRAYVYEGKIQLLAARLYQGQTTNFRTNGGGFAPVFVAS